MLGVGFSDADEDDIKITNNEGRSGQPESATTFTNLVIIIGNCVKTLLLKKIFL